MVVEIFRSVYADIVKNERLVLDNVLMPYIVVNGVGAMVGGGATGGATGGGTGSGTGGGAEGPEGPEGLFPMLNQNFA